MNILETNHLTFNYRNHSVLEDINLKIPEGVHLWILRQEWGG